MHVVTTQTCLICLTEWQVNTSRNNPHTLCLECRRTEKQIDYGHETPCIPWRGEFDDNDNPLKNGVLYMPGQRKCNHRDCVQKAHVLPSVQDLTAERWSIFHRTGKRLDYHQLMHTLQQEKATA